MKQSPILALVLTLFSASPALSGPSLALGGAGGTLSQTKESGSVSRFNFGGVTISPGYNQDIYNQLSLTIEYEGLLDYASSQLLRQAFNIGLAWHIWGGAGSYSREYPGIKVVKYNNYGFSLIGKAGLHNYAASDPTDPSVNVKGGVFQFLVGFAYRVLYDDDLSFGLAFVTAVKGFPTGVERLESQSAGVELFLHF